MPPDAAPPSRLGAPLSSRNAVRAGVLAALSSPAAAATPAAAQAAPEVAGTAGPVQHPPARGFGASLRAAGRRGLLMARPLALPLLHRLQMRMRTAVNESDVAARVAGIERALARLSDRFETEIAARREIADVKRLAEEAARRLDAVGSAVAQRSDATHRRLDDAQRHLDAIRREIAGVGEVAAGNARRLDAVNAAAADGARRQEAAQRRLDEAHQRLDGTHQRLDEARERLDGTHQRLDGLQRSVAAVPDAVQARLPPRAPIPLGGEVMAWTPDGPLLLPAEDARLLAAMSEGGVLEPGTRAVLASLLKPGATFLDVGAHVGTMTLPAARRVGEDGRVFAVEPLPRLAALLRRNLALNDVADRVAVAACAAGEAEAEGLLHLGEILGHSSLLPLPAPDAAGTVRVPVRRVDDVVPAGTRVDVAKIDAEGTELQVWRGMRRVLEESPSLAAVLEFGPSHLARAGVTPEAWLGELEAAGFAPYTIDEATGACRPANVPALAGVFSVNVLLLRPDAASRHPDLVFA